MNNNSNLQNFLTGGLGYVVGLIAGIALVWVISFLDLGGLLVDLIPAEQDLVRLLGIALVFLLILGSAGAVMGILGGAALSRILGTTKRTKILTGSAVAFGIGVGLLLIVFLLITSFFALYNNLTSERFEQFGLLFGIYGLVFGLVVGILQAVLTLRLRYTWRAILASVIGFTLGGILMGLIVQLVNPSEGFKTFPILTWIVLFLALAAPFFFGGGALGFSYGRISRRVFNAGDTIESALAPRWQIIIVAVIGILITVPIVSLVAGAANFLTIRPANIQSQIGPTTTGVRWNQPQEIALESLAEDGQAVVVVTGSPDEGLIAAMVWADGNTEDADVYLQEAAVDGQGQAAAWSDAVNVSNSSALEHQNPQVAGDSQGNLHITWSESDISGSAVIRYSRCSEGSCSEPETISFAAIGAQTPAVIADRAGTLHIAWCNPSGVIQYQQGTGPLEEIASPGCSSPPSLTLDSEGFPHLAWYAQEITDTNGASRSTSVLVESVRLPQGSSGTAGWSTAAIAAQIEAPQSVALSGDSAGGALLAWLASDDQPAVLVASKEQYACDPDDLPELQQPGLETLVSGDSRPANTEVPFCRNQFGSILYTPNPEPEYSNEPITPNGAFDRINALSENAQYEVLFTTMQWEPTTTNPSPGGVLAAEVGELYRKVKANPQAYPRGMTVRILLGNYPVFSNLNWGDQIIDAINDFKAAGVETMVDPEIGWRLEVANYPGTYPHAHTKFAIVDGAAVAGAGFNYGYLHFPKDHPSGKGFDMFDLGMSVAGPVAQDAISHFDDMWEGADQIQCDDLSLPGNEWQNTCQEVKATSDHVPEVLLVSLPPEGDSNAFSLYRTTEFKEADDFIAASLASATESIDVMQANFSLDLVCILNLINPNVCSIDDALPWMNAMLEAIERDRVKMRVIMENSNSYGLENRVAGKILLEELEKRGLGGLVELRFYNGKMHSKGVSIDDELLIIGSQNFHYSAWGEGGLAEYSITTDDPEAIAEYQALFEAKWEQAIPFEEAEYGS